MERENRFVDERKRILRGRIRQSRCLIHGHIRRLKSAITPNTNSPFSESDFSIYRTGVDYR